LVREIVLSRFVVAEPQVCEICCRAGGLHAGAGTHVGLLGGGLEGLMDERLAQCSVGHHLGLDDTLHFSLGNDLVGEVASCGLGPLVRAVVHGLSVETKAESADDALLWPLDGPRPRVDGQPCILVPPCRVARHVARVPLIHLQPALQRRWVGLDPVCVRADLVVRQGCVVGCFPLLPQPQPRGVRGCRVALDASLEADVR